jgi:hypothetical protein
VTDTATKTGCPAFTWRPSLGRSLAAAPTIGLLPFGFVIGYGARIGDQALSAAALLAYIIFVAVISALIVRTHVTVSDGRLTVHRLRTRSCFVRDISRLVVVPIAYPGLRSASGVVTALAFGSTGSVLIKVAAKSWTPVEIDHFIDACHVANVTRVSETMTPVQAMARWPGSYSPRSQWRGYVILVTTIAFLVALAGLLSWAVVALQSGH